MALGVIAATGACSRPRPAAAVPRQLLLVTLPDSRSVAIFASGTSGDGQPLGTIHESAPDTPVDSSINLRGEVFVANRNGSINVFAGRNYNYQLVRSLSGPHTQLLHPSSMAVDPLGNIYVADLGAPATPAKIIWIPAGLNGNVFPERVVSGPHTGLRSPSGIAIDASEEVFVADHESGQILIFAADAHGDANPITTIGGFNGPQRIFVDQDLNLYVSCDGDSSIVVLAPDGPLRWTRTATITSPTMTAPIGVAADSAGQIAAAVHGAVLYFAAGANGPSTPVIELQGPAPMNPAGLLIR
jgi:hypothetical protein